jgi:hypothetical protein
MNLMRRGKGERGIEGKGALVKALKGMEREGLVKLRLGRFLEGWRGRSG